MMNERIKQLADQARFVNTVEYPHQDEVFEKFAELIVRECIGKIETYQIPVGNSAAGEMAAEWTYEALREIRDDIKETFGVE